MPTSLEEGLMPPEKCENVYDLIWIPAIVHLSTLCWLAWRVGTVLGMMGYEVKI